MRDVTRFSIADLGSGRASVELGAFYRKTLTLRLEIFNVPSERTLVLPNCLPPGAEVLDLFPQGFSGPNNRSNLRQYRPRIYC